MFKFSFQVFGHASVKQKIAEKRIFASNTEIGKEIVYLEGFVAINGRTINIDKFGFECDAGLHDDDFFITKVGN